MPIKQIKLRKLQMRLKDPFTTSFGTMQDKEFYITEAIDGEGNSGFGESVAFISPWYSEETVKTNLHIMEDFLIKILKENEISHPDQISELFQPIKGHNMAKSALEGAIWDLYAKRQNITLAEALGGEKKEIDVGISIGIQPSIEDLLQTIKGFVQEGYKRMKIKIKPGWDVDVLREVRANYPDLPIMADANSAYTLDDIEHLQKLDDLNLTMIEQPLGHDDIVDHAKLQAVMKTPICLDESIHSLEDTRKAIQLGSCKIINIKIGRVGGLTEAKKIHDYCKDHDIAVWCGGMLEAGVGRAHNIALTTLDQFILPGDTAGSSRYWVKDIIKPEVVVHKGVITVPDKPGIGYDIDESALEEFTVDEKVFNF
ncbi:o-succinylbenzoate synthase [Virgibacillus profundi]|uniref:o-succinylbenzoate synthase n=1 Tax=Virgibacillus profundi TaxID=2024555 RepID=A0A2A2ICV5_9BACI|nr:o-succinylbenzoate synthase [Virgibacillus profundi]PAV29841.1 o-succinylbenzoate synthase [Virgibacillus profundi]PXY54013.1 o-succinylbenzoate synthase [Virgibacillus profundi]